MKVIAIPTKIYDSADTPLSSPNLMTMNTTISEKMKVLRTSIVFGNQSLNHNLSQPSEK